MQLARGTEFLTVPFDQCGGRLLATVGHSNTQEILSCGKRDHVTQEMRRHANSRTNSNSTPSRHSPLSNILAARNFRRSAF